MKPQTLIHLSTIFLILGLIGCTAPVTTAVAESVTARSAEPPTPILEEPKTYSELERKKIFKEIPQAEDRGTNEAISQIPTDIMKQIDLEQELKTKYKTSLAKKYGLTYNQLQKIGYEGVVNNWLTK